VTRRTSAPVTRDTSPARACRAAARGNVGGRLENHALRPLDIAIVAEGRAA
jgi:hypothetical protein